MWVYCKVGMMPEGCLLRSTASVGASLMISAIRTPRGFCCTRREGVVL
jgi:hypothetical protein